MNLKLKMLTDTKFIEYIFLIMCIAVLKTGNLKINLILFIFFIQYYVWAMLIRIELFTIPPTKNFVLLHAMWYLLTKDLHYTEK
jgi:hypothetical protein